MFLIFDTETTGLPLRDDAPLSDFENWPRAVQIAWQLHDAEGKLIESQDHVIFPDGFDIPFKTAKFHGISTAVAKRYGIALEEALAEFSEAVNRAHFLVGHNLQFDNNILGAEYLRLGQENILADKAVLDTGRDTTDYCQLAGGRGGKYKMPRLQELHQKLFGKEFAEAHNAAADVEATARCFFEAIRLGIFSLEQLGWTAAEKEAFLRANPEPIRPIGLEHRSFKILAEALEAEAKESSSGESEIEATAIKSEKQPFVHLHLHTQYSVLQATCDIKSTISKAKELGMNAVAMTDSGHLYGAFKFVTEARNQGIKPIVGCEFNLCRDHRDHKVKDNGFRLVAWAKNKAGYHNLAKLSSQAYIDGFYYLPRIDRELLLQYQENLIISTGGLGAEVPHLILNVGEKQAEDAFCWYHEHFGADFYVELQNHGLEEERAVNETLMRFARKYGVEYFASNDVYYLDQADANAHDILLCVKDGEFQSTPIGRGRGYRFGFANNEYYFKSGEEMQALFREYPDALANSQKIADQIESYDLAREVLLPAFDIPAEFRDPKDAEDGGKRGENAYLRFLTYEGAKKRYGEVSAEIAKRLDFELETIANTGYPGYFLIVQDFTSQARKMGVSVGPGRGSAAGSAVAYCIGITNVDPIKYDLLFERFLNPDRVSLPDIDIDFDDEGRAKIIDWVVKKYGQNQVAQIITYGTMAGKSAIRDAGRVLELPLSDTDRVAKTMPELKLQELFGLEPKKLQERLNGNDQYQLALKMKELAGGNNKEAEVIQQARILEGSVRNTGIHACGVIITPDDITKFVPVTVAKDAELLVTQFDNSVVESAGMLKMDFLGLKTLSVIKDAIHLIEARHGVKIDPDEIPLDDAKTLALYQAGETNGTFQFESPGMQKHLKALRPDKFEDLIAMNALYRPGPLKYIPNFIARKHGQEEISYDLPEMEDNLAETYGITVYQEQVMLLSQKLAGFSKGEADVLRKAMGKKKRDVLDKLKPDFIERGQAQGHPSDKLEKIWSDWEEFAAYAFNKSHSTCYSVVAFHTGYLKAHYPAEYMASVLTHNMNDIKKVSFFMEECQRMGIPVLGPDVNESEYKFTANDKGEIRFGLGGMKGVGGGAVLSIVKERKEGGPYRNIFDFLKRVDLKSANKKTLESLALGGAFDSFEGTHRAVFFSEQDGRSFLERAMRYANDHKAREASAQVSLFGESEEVSMPEPEIPQCETWPRMVLLGKEKEVNGLYLSSHPLDDFRYEMNLLTSHKMSHFYRIDSLNEFTVGGIISSALHLTTRNGKPFGRFSLEDYSGKYEFSLFGEDYLRFKPYLEPNMMILAKGQVQRYRPRYEGAEERIEPKFSQISLLQDALNQFARSVELQIPLNLVSEQSIESLNQIIDKYPGDKSLEVVIFDPEKIKISVRLPRRAKTGLELSKKSLDEIAALPFAKMTLKSKAR